MPEPAAVTPPTAPRIGLDAPPASSELTRDVCIASGDATARALRLKAEVEKSLAELEKGTLPKESAEAQALPKKLDDAQKLLEQGHDGLPRCDEEVQALRRKHRI